jgi:hypothetical protein
MELKKRINAFVKLGDFFRKFSDHKNEDNDHYEKLSRIVLNDHQFNPWFTKENINLAIMAIGNSLKESNIHKWLSQYPELNLEKKSKRIGVVTAGNLPLVGFHDFISVLITGNIFVGKLSLKDDRLLKFIADYLIDTNAEFKNLIFFEENQLTTFDAIIATGSNNTSRYFEYYFGKYPHIIRHNRNSIAVLTGSETHEKISLLADDIFQYFGLGCRNVSKLFIPEGYNFNLLFEHINHYQHLYQHNKYANNHDYNRSVYLMNQTTHLDNGFVLLKEDIQMASPIAVLYYEFYKNIERVNQYIEVNEDQIQCVVSESVQVKNAIPFGKAQQPELWDYADNVDTLKFLLNL